MEVVTSGKTVEKTNKQNTFYVVRPQIRDKRTYTVFKRIFDMVISFIGIVVLALPMAIIALAIIIDSNGNPIFRQERLGKNGKPFIMLKFRSMYVDAEKGGPQWADVNDKRCTKLGYYLRKSRLDELPQLWNILKGEMSFVGPRPERRYFYEEFEKYIIGFSNRLVVTPGLTGYAQVMGGYELKPEEKIVYDMKYIECRSLRMDLMCIMRTIGVVLKKNGAR